MAEQAPPYKGQEGTMNTDVWSSGYGRAKGAGKKPQDQMELVTFEGIRKQLTAQIDELANSGKNEGAGVLRKLRQAMDDDVVQQFAVPLDEGECLFSFEDTFDKAYEFLTR